MWCSFFSLIARLAVLSFFFLVLFPSGCFVFLSSITQKHPIAAQCPTHVVVLREKLYIVQVTRIFIRTLVKLKLVAKQTVRTWKSRRPSQSGHRNCSKAFSIWVISSMIRVFAGFFVGVVVVASSVVPVVVAAFGTPPSSSSEDESESTS